MIYGASEQSVASWIENIQLALRYEPEELYLYPLYVRPLTGLAKSAREWDDHRVELYRAGRDYLCSHGYKQVSMRMFRRLDAPTANAPAYECQRDGMVGLGCGARSYTSSLHYSEEWAVGARSVREILHAFINRPEREFALARYGIELDEGEPLRRAAILSLLSDEGPADGPRADALTELSLLIERGLARREGARVVLTDAGLERADAVGPALLSASVRRKMQAFSLR